MLHSVSVLVLHNSSFLVFFFGLLTYPFDRSIVWSAFVLRVFVVRRFSFVILLLLVRCLSFVVRCLSFVVFLSLFFFSLFVVRRSSFVCLSFVVFLSLFFFSLFVVRRSSFVVRCLSFVFRSFLFVRPLVL